MFYVLHPIRGKASATSESFSRHVFSSRTVYNLSRKKRFPPFERQRADRYDSDELLCSVSAIFSERSNLLPKNRKLPSSKYARPATVSYIRAYTSAAHVKPFFDFHSPPTRRSLLVRFEVKNFRSLLARVLGNGRKKIPFLKSNPLTNRE